MTRDYDTMLVRWYNGELSADEIDTLAAWLREAEENRLHAQEIYNICFAADTAGVPKRFDAEAALKKTQSRIAAGWNKKTLMLARNVAAALLIPVVLAAGMLLHRLSGQRESEPAMVQLRTVTGMLSNITLPDGSTVQLNANSTLSYPGSFGKSKREVELDGEAFFDIAHDKQHPFIVHTHEIDIQVTGTRFNVDAYNLPGRKTRTWLEEGGINLLWRDAAGESKTAALRPGQCAILAPETRAVEITPADISGALAWKEGGFAFRDTPLEEALRQIGNRFCVNFTIKNKALAGKRYTGNLGDESLQTILRDFELADGIRFKTLENNDGSGRKIMEVY
ncbi:MAG: FecR domain-containing protein [Bacteroidales bacterium]|nr:FecR domain-containing protein [Bacteroidales bacterium]